MMAQVEPGRDDLVPAQAREGAAAASPRDALLDLKARIRAIERSGAVGPVCPAPRFLVGEDGGGAPLAAPVAAPPSSLPATSGCPASDRLAWRLGAGDVDARLGFAGLELGGVHEIKPAARATAAARTFALCLAAGRMRVGDKGAQGPIVWCEAQAASREHGRLHGPGLGLLGLAFGRVIIVEPAHSRDVLWAMEEALSAGAAAAVIGQIEEAALTPARRLALAAARGGAPCLLITHGARAAAAATATRWRVAAHPSAPHPFDPAAPGVPRFAVQLERCRAAPRGACDVSFVLEWCDATYRFRMASDVADRAHADLSVAAAGGRGRR